MESVKETTMLLLVAGHGLHAIYLVVLQNIEKAERL
jgi:hypothetical protein